MDSTNYNAKCLKCGYIFEADDEKEKAVCPLCGEENNKTEALNAFDEKFKDYKPKKKTTLRMAADLAIFGISLCALIFVLYFLVTLIISFIK